MVSLRTPVIGILLALGAAGPVSLHGQTLPDLNGSWALNRQLSQFPTEVGFVATFLDNTGALEAPSGRRGGGGGGGLNPPRVQSETAEDAQRVRFLTDEVRLPYEGLTITMVPEAVTIAPNRTAARTFHPGRRDEEVPLGRSTGSATASWEPDRLVILYKAQAGRSLRYSYSINPSPRQLIVDVEFIERGTGDRVRRIYEPASAAPTAAPSTAATTPPNSGSPTAPAPAPSSAANAPAAPPALSRPPAAALDRRPDAALIGLNRLGLVIEGIGADAVKCGLKQDAVETAVSKRLTEAGLRVIRDSDDDSYLYVNINTVTASANLCVSRYDVTLYSHTTATLSHTTAPVLVQVELLHDGGLAGGGPAAHAEGVLKGLLGYLGQFVTRVRNANN